MIHSFGVEGAKSGDTLRVRVPVRVQSTTGSAPAGTNFTETYKTVATQTQRNILLEWTSKDLALALDDFSDRVIEPVVAQLASDIDSDGCTAAVAGSTVTNSGYVTANYAGSYSGIMGLATPGAISAVTGPAAWTGVDLGSGASAANTATKPFFDAKARLDEQSAPMKDRFCVLSPAAASATQPNLLTIFNPTGAVSEMFEEGIMGQLAGAKFYQSQNIPLFTSGTWTNNANVSVTSNASGDTSLSLGRVGASAAIADGDQFVVSGVYSVNPLNRQSTNKLQVFTVVSAVTANAGGNVVVTVYPAIANSGNYQTVSAVPQAAANVTFMGTSNTSTQANFMYQKNAIALVVAPLARDLPGAEVSSVTDEEAGLSIRFAKQYQSLTDQVVNRLDVLYGWSVVRPELGVRIQA